MTTKKIDKFGNYLPFPGFTVVADVYEQNSELFRRIFNRLQENTLIVNHNGLLPVESYHITTFSLGEKRKMNDSQFSDWIRHQLRAMQTTHSELEANTTPFTFRITGVCNKRLTFFCEVDSAVAEQQKSVAEMTPYADRIPRHFHISLGYQFNENRDPVFLASVHEQLLAILSEELPDFASVELRANQPKLCYFHDMTKFIPFDGSTNPFASQDI